MDFTPIGADGRIDPDALDVPDRATALLRESREQGEPALKQETEAIAPDADPDLDRS